jgi:hypothetical protein
MRRVFSSPSLLAVHHARNLLETAGIRTTLRNEMLAAGLGELPFGDCQPELWVEDSVEDGRAERLLREGLVPPVAPGPRWHCACGEDGEAQFTQCWRCGALRVD